MNDPKEYIEREALIDSFENSYWLYNSTDREIVRQALENAPAADVAPVVHGERLLRHAGHGHYWECSVCHTNPCIYVTENTKFCPNCGAKMDGGSE